jgi:hypothetical protein
LYSAGWLTDRLTRVGLAFQYLRGEVQEDGDRSHFGGLLLDVEIFGSLTLGVFGHLDVNHGFDPGLGGVLRLDPSELEELGFPVPRGN